MTTRARHLAMLLCLIGIHAKCQAETFIAIRLETIGGEPVTLKKKPVVRPASGASKQMSVHHIECLQTGDCRIILNSGGGESITTDSDGSPLGLWQIVVGGEGFEDYVVGPVALRTLPSGEYARADGEQLKVTLT